MNCSNKVWKVICLECLTCNIANTKLKLNLQQLSANIKYFGLQL